MFCCVYFWRLISPKILICEENVTDEKSLRIAYLKNILKQNFFWKSLLPVRCIFTNTTTTSFFSSYVVSELAHFARGRIEVSSLTGSHSTAFQNCLLKYFSIDQSCAISQHSRNVTSSSRSVCLLNLLGSSNLLLIFVCLGSTLSTHIFLNINLWRKCYWWKTS